MVTALDPTVVETVVAGTPVAAAGVTVEAEAAAEAIEEAAVAVVRTEALEVTVAAGSAEV